jgi:hypothetical protein
MDNLKSGTGCSREDFIAARRTLQAAAPGQRIPPTSNFLVPNLQSAFGRVVCAIAQELAPLKCDLLPGAHAFHFEVNTPQKQTATAATRQRFDLSQVPAISQDETVA